MCPYRDFCMKPTRPIRHEVHDYLKARGFELTQEDIVFISSKMSEYADNKADNLKELGRKYAFTEEKVGMYLKKAKKMPPSALLKAQVERRKSNKQLI